MTRLALALLLALGLTAPVLAHRLNEYLQATTVAVGHDTVTIQLRLTPGVDIARQLISSLDADRDGAFSDAEAAAYAGRILSDLSLSIDGRAVPLHLDTWSFSSFSEMARGQAESTLTLSAAFPDGSATHELALENRHQSAIAAYLVNALQPEMADVRIVSQWRNYNQSRYAMAFVIGAPVAGTTLPVRSSAGPILRTYTWHGLTHILGGYDHLLFLAALVLGAVTLWDLVKIVTAFTVAHSLTLTLAALNLVHVSSRIVEPFIAASIIFVALQNVFWPRRARGGDRLAVAFFFGLFHGFGFAGGLLELMQQMPTSTVLLAVCGFSIGVEAGNQLVMLPLFAAISFARRQQHHESAGRAVAAFRRVGSAGISIAGAYYFWMALAQAL